MGVGCNCSRNGPALDSSGPAGIIDRVSSRAVSIGAPLADIRHTCRRLSLGVLLIVLASAVLLVADWGRRTPARGPIPRIALVQHASTAVLDDGIAGLLEGLAARGFRAGDTIAIERFNAQGDMATGAAIARQVTTSGVDLVITASTPSMQAVANNNREGRTRHVFFLVADPFASGVGLDRADPSRHPAHLVGQGIMAPVDESFALARQCLPSLQRVGVAWNPAESNSLVFTEKAREAATRLGVELLEANVDTTFAVTDAVNSLIARGAQALWVGGDNTMIAAIDSVIALARRGGIPVFTVLPGRPDRGTLFDIGPDFVESGRQAASLVADVLEGADLAAIPIRSVSDVVPPFLSVNLTTLQGLAEPWRIPDEVKQRATVLVDERGVRDSRTNRSEAARQARIPTFVFQSSQVKTGAVAAIARDYHDADRETARLIARMLRGETPATIPLVAFEKTRRLVNLDVARHLGVRVPQSVIDRADAVITPQHAGSR